jgi:hypothetical protein
LLNFYTDAAAHSASHMLAWLDTAHKGWMLFTASFFASGALVSILAEPPFD